MTFNLEIIYEIFKTDTKKLFEIDLLHVELSLVIELTRVHYRDELNIV